ncbi:protein of unknown function [Agreia sp. COWG]|nr:protein of unknown function [Agreia sp. COWG]
MLKIVASTGARNINTQTPPFFTR